MYVALVIYQTLYGLLWEQGPGWEKSNYLNLNVINK